MADIATIDTWSPTVYQWADGDVLDGGPESLEVLPVKQMANRSLFQRLRSVTPWSDVLAAAYGYPEGACVMHADVSWRAKIANAVEPGTDATKWERWGFSDDEFNAKLATFLPYAAPTACANTGPDGVADKSKIHKSALGEYWMWLGDAWGVVWNKYGSYYNNGAAGAAVAAGGKQFNQITAHRDGVISVTASARMVAAASGDTLDVSIDLAGVSVVSDAIVATVVGQGMYTSASIQLPVTAGQVLRAASYSNYAGTAFYRASAYYSK